MKKALVSGGAGFIGSHLCTRLVTGLSVLITFLPEAKII